MTNNSAGQRSEDLDRVAVCERKYVIENNEIFQKKISGEEVEYIQHIPCYYNKMYTFYQCIKLNYLKTERKDKSAWKEKTINAELVFSYHAADDDDDA